MTDPKMDSGGSEHVKGDLRTTVRDQVLEIEICRPEKRNALTVGMYEGLVAALDDAQRRSDIRAILIYGQPEAFTSGNDLKDFLERPALDDDHPAFAFVRTIGAATKPIVAAVRGVCVGVGATMLLHCDLVYAGEQASFALPFVNLGLCPEAGSSLLLPLAAGHARAAELLLLGEPFDAAVAAQCGLVSRVLPDGEVEAYARTQARKLAAKPPGAVRLSKALMRRPWQPHIADTIEHEAARFRECLESPEAKEAFAAFLAKRKPDFARFT